MSASSSFRLDEAVDALSRTPALLRGLLGGREPAWTEARERAGAWSPFDVLGHLIEGERSDWIPRIRRLLAEGEARPFDPFDRTVQAPDVPTTAGRLDELEKLRGESVRALEALDLKEADLDRRGLHPELGPVTLRNLIATWVVHDLAHLAQVARALSSRYGSEVGPWRHPDYLRILAD